MRCARGQICQFFGIGLINCRTDQVYFHEKWKYTWSVRQHSARFRNLQQNFLYHSTLLSSHHHQPPPATISHHQPPPATTSHHQPPLDRATGPLVSYRGWALGSPNLPAPPPLVQPPPPCPPLLLFRWGIRWTHSLQRVAQSSGLYCAARLLIGGNYWYAGLTVCGELLSPQACTVPLDCWSTEITDTLDSQSEESTDQRTSWI